MTICIISHTEHYLTEQNQIVGWGPTITEINHLAKDFDKIYHLAFLYDEKPKKSALPYTSTNIEFVALPVVGGKSIKDKIAIFTHIPSTLKIIHNVLQKVDAFQFRTPIGFGVYLIPYLTLFSTKKGWYKYAGNWNQKNASLGYGLQRFFLKHQHRTVTINGKWPNQNINCLTFENPCLTEKDRINGKKITSTKLYEPPFNFCFIGRLENEKGVQRIIDAIDALKNKNLVDYIYMIGDGANKKDYEKQVKEKSLPIQFYGFMSRQEVFDIYKKSHFLLLPSSASEGFPKVIAESMNYGCIPIVSNVSSIGQYINQTNGFIVTPNNSIQLNRIIESLEFLDANNLQRKAEKGYDVAKDFTFERYRHRIKNEILNF